MIPVGLQLTRLNHMNGRLGQVARSFPMLCVETQIPLSVKIFSCDCDRQEGFPPRYNTVRAVDICFTLSIGTRGFMRPPLFTDIMYGSNNGTNRVDSWPRKLLHARNSLLQQKK